MINKCVCGSTAKLFRGTFTDDYCVECIDQYCSHRSGNYDTPEEAEEGWNDGDRDYYGN